MPGAPRPPAPPKGVLLPWQRKLYRILLIPLGLMAADSIYLLSFTKYSSFFMAMFLLHLALGLLLSIPFFTFAATHARKMIRMRNLRAKYAGLAIASLAVIVTVTGLLMTFKGATIRNRPIYLAHVLATPAALVAFILHRRAHSHQMAFKKLFAWGGAVAGFLLVMAVLHLTEKPPQRIVNRAGDTQYFLSSAETFDQGPARSRQALLEPVLPGVPRRKLRAVAQVRAPFQLLQQSVLPALGRAHGGQKVGREKTKWCAGCHDPVVLSLGQNGESDPPQVHLRRLRGPAGPHLHVLPFDRAGEGTSRETAPYVIEESRQYPFAFAKNRYLHEVNKLLIRMEPRRSTGKRS